MDRNTLLAFFLISLVLIFTPKYMEMVSPVSEPIGVEESSELDSVRTSDRQVANPQISEPVSGPDRKVVVYKPPSLSQGSEKLLNIS